jgi:hypothetical protein
MTSIFIVTKVPNAVPSFESDEHNPGNLAAPLGDNMYLQEMSGSFRKLQFMEQLALRTPVFYLGELLYLDGNDRDQFGRKPDKWNIEIEYIGELENAVSDVKEILDRVRNESRKPAEQKD